ncbi:MAG: 6,7-dimethyl-8-ribityllumazine synthase [Candidatus Magasanikbacteria bacterium]|nr:6,7-dimethyl-8-ribityllumazine synthase [Candidatus Magasanikbacteria bacterium]
MKNGQHKSEIFNASKFRFGIVQATFNSDITEKILEYALKTLSEYKVVQKNITIHKVPGSVEIPVVLQAMAKSKKYDALIAIGAVIKGKTDHYHVVAKFVTEGVLRVSLDNILPIGFAVLTTQNKKLAQERVTIGAEAVEAVLQVVKICNSGLF